MISIGCQNLLQEKNSRPRPDMNVLGLRLHNESHFRGRVLSTGQHANSTDRSSDSVDLIYCPVSPEISLLCRWSQFVSVNKDLSIWGN